MKKLIGGQDSLFPWVLHPVHLYEYGLELGLSAEELLHGAGLSSQDIDDVDLHITWQQYRLIADVVAGIASDWGRIGNPMGFRGVWLTPGAAVNRRLRSGMCRD
ncbi:MAG: hypothetical protein IPO13_02390 [Rhodocyclaceae bacterium]|nr:hypothetical protein [Rhodocyclaceae bacterium]